MMSLWRVIVEDLIIVEGLMMFFIDVIVEGLMMSLWRVNDVIAYCGGLMMFFIVEELIIVLVEGLLM